jgi:hypothetical protein
LTEGVIAAALVLAPGGWVVLAVLFGMAVSQRLRGKDLLKLQYNTAQVAASAAVAVVLADSLPAGNPVLAAAVAMAGYWALNQTLSALPVAILSGQPLRRLVTESVVLHAVHAAGSVSIGLLGAWLARTEPVALLGLLVPTALLWMSYDEQISRVAEARLFAELARGQERAANPSTDVLATAVVTAAARLFRGAEVEMVLLEQDGPVTYAGTEHGVRRRRADAGALDASWVLRALGARGVLTGSERGRPFCSAVMGDPDRPLAVLVARRPAGAAPFGRRETALAAVLVRQARSWLATDDRTGSFPDLRADGVAPALRLLRDSTARLARLATAGGTGALPDIVDELHAVERAVASLLGLTAHGAAQATAQAAAPASPPPAPAVTGPPQAWTTTGVLREVAARP